MSEIDWALSRPPLGVVPVTGTVTVEERRHAMVTLRAELDDPAVAQAVDAITGAGMPKVRRYAGDGARFAAWMAPDELMLFAPYGEGPEIARRLSDPLAGVRHLAADMSDARAAFRISGPGARGVLAKGAPVDLTPGAFGVGDVRRTRIGLVAAAFWMQQADPETFGVICFRSYARHMWDWLVASAKHPAPL